MAALCGENITAGGGSGRHKLEPVEVTSQRAIARRESCESWVIGRVPRTHNSRQPTK